MSFNKYGYAAVGSDIYLRIGNNSCSHYTCKSADIRRVFKKRSVTARFHIKAEHAVEIETYIIDSTLVETCYHACPRNYFCVLRNVKRVRIGSRLSNDMVGCEVNRKVFDSTLVDCTKITCISIRSRTAVILIGIAGVFGSCIIRTVARACLDRNLVAVTVEVLGKQCTGAVSADLVVSRFGDI